MDTKTFWEVESEKSAEECCFRSKTLEERTVEFDGELMLDGEYDWGEPVGKEVW